MAKSLQIKVTGISEVKKALKDGNINLLRKAGYTVKPVMN